ncbi:MAG: phosphatidylserine decarboxylase [Algisphaera sp.]
MFSPSAKNECLVIASAGGMVALALGLRGHWLLAIFAVVVAFALLLFFRDPERHIPSQRGAVVAPADGKISSIHHLDHFAPLGGPAVCVRIFMSVFDVHINRCPCHGKITSITPKAGKYRNTLNPEAAEDNTSNTLLMVHPIKGYPVAAVRQIAGLLARTIHCDLEPGQVVQRGQRLGLIKLGSTTELYLPEPLLPQIQIAEGQMVKAGITVLATVSPLITDDEQNKDDDSFENQPNTNTPNSTPPHDDTTPSVFHNTTA